MRDLRIVFMGTPPFAVTILDALVQKGYAIAGVITAPDKPAGRGRKLHQSAVKQYAVQQQLPVLQPTNLKNETFLEELKALDANLFVVVAFRMLPRAVWTLPEYGTFNLHASLLPNYRGAAPINWAIINGEKETGVTTFFIDDKIDTGAMIFQEKTAIGEDENAGSLHDRLMQLGADLVVKTVSAIANDTVQPISQREEAAIKDAPKIHKDTCRISWDQDLDAVYNHIRGLSPYPAAWTILKDEGIEKSLKIFSCQKERSNHQFPPGSLVLEKKTFKIAVPNGFIIALEVQLEGKRRMPISELRNGLKLSETARVF